MKSSCQPGDLFVLDLSSIEEGEELYVEWLVLEAPTGGDLLAVPADTRPFAGSGDVELPKDHPLSPLVIRCRQSVRLPLGLWAPEKQTGRLEAEILARVEERRGGARDASAAAGAVDQEAEYRLWMWQLGAVCERLEQSCGTAEAAVLPFRPSGEAPEMGGENAVLGGSSRSSAPAVSSGGYLKLVAAALVGLVVGAALVTVWQPQRVTDPRAPGVAAQPNVPLLWLTPRRERSAAPLYTVPATSPLVLVLDVLDSHPVFEAELWRGDELLWSHDALTPTRPETGGSTLRVVLPVHLLASGSYRLRLAGRRADEVEEITDYQFRLELEQDL